MEEKISKGLKAIYDQRESSVIQLIDIISSTIQDYEMRLVRQRTELNQLLQQQKILIGDRRRRKTRAKRDARLLSSIMGDKIDRAYIEDEKLVVHTNFITLEYDGYDYPMSAYTISIPLDFSGEHNLKIIADEKPEDGRGYHHPHVDSDGTCCLGNIRSTVNTLIQQGKTAQLAILLVDFLNSYNSGSPFYELGSGKNYESCFEDASSSDCVSCGEDICPYWDERYDRCWENVEDEAAYKECISCSECDFSDKAMETCHQNMIDEETQTFCISGCNKAACVHWQNADNCKEVNPDHCKGCDLTECQNHESDDETEE